MSEVADRGFSAIGSAAPGAKPITTAAGAVNHGLIMGRDRAISEVDELYEWKDGVDGQSASAGLFLEAAKRGYSVEQAVRIAEANGIPVPGRLREQARMQVEGTMIPWDRP